MAARVQWVGYGRAAAEALRAQIADAKAGDALAPVTVVVPSNHVGVAARRLLASGALGPVTGTTAGLVAVSFVTPYRLAELLGAPVLAATGRRPVSTPVIAAALRATLHDAAGLFAPVAAHPATETALVATYRELREVSDAGLDAIASRGRRAADVVRVHRATRARLEPAWYDEQDLMHAAAGAAGAHDSAVGRELGAPVLYLPQRLTPHMLAMLGAIAAARDLSVVAGVTGDGRADAEIVAAITRLVPDAPAPAPAPLTGDPVCSTVRTRIALASDADDEVRAAIRRVVDAVRAATPLDRIAILHAGTEPYARLVHEHLAAAGVPSNGPSIVPLAGRVAGRALLGLFALPERGFRRQDVFAWLATAPVWRRGAPAPIMSWERLSRAAGVVSGREQWDERLDRFVAELDARIAAAAARGEDDDGRVAHERRDAARARDLRAFVVGFIDDLARASARPRGWAAHATWARRMLAAIVGDATRRDEWPADERKAAERVDAALSRLAALDAVESAVGLDVFARTLALELENDLGRIGRFGDGVFVGPIAMGVGLDLDLAAVLGLAEGTCPAPVRDDSLLPDSEREAAAGELALRRTRVDREHRELLAALAGAQQQLLGVPRGDLRRSTELVPSRWVLDIASTLAGESWWSDELFGAQEPWVNPVASFDAGLRALEFPATEQEHRLRTLLAAPPTGAAALATVTDDSVLAGNATAVAARRSAGFTRFDGNLAGVGMPSPVDGITSATRLQSWSSCPFAYFVDSVLRVEAVDNPEDVLQISALERGSLVHEALERFVLEILASPAPEQPAPGAQWNAHQKARMRAIGEEVCAQYEARGVTGRSLYWQRDQRRVLADLTRFLTEDERLRATHQSRPVAAELPFGLARGGEPVPLRLADGRTLHFRGMADRVDRADDGSLVVIDYKTGKRDRYKGLSAEDPDRGGSLLQLPVYGIAARQHAGTPDAPVHALYWFVSERGEFKTEGYEVTDHVLELVGATLGWIVSGIEAGIFASRPTQMSTAIFNECPACNPDALGVTELRRAWERKRDDAALVPYSKLVEPYDADGDDA